MFTNYKKLAKEIISQLRSEPEILSQVVKSLSDEIKEQDIKKEIKDAFVAECVESLRKLHKVKMLEQLGKRNFALDVQIEMRRKIQKEIECSVQKILED